jgi:hypothetical protein
MSGINALAIRFWTEFDAKLNPGLFLVDNSGNVIFDEIGRPKRLISQKLRDAVGNVFGLDRAFIGNYDRLTGKLNVEDFVYAVNSLGIEEDIKMLSQKQLEIIKNYFTIDNSDLRDAFEYFGQGSLYDSQHDSLRVSRHPNTGEFIPYRVHMADGPGVYGIWHTFIRASTLLRIEGIDVKSWIEIDRLLALAYMIHYTVKPLQSFQFPGGDSAEHIPLKQTTAWRDENIHLIDSWRTSVYKANSDELDKILGRSYYFQSPFD